MIAPFHPPDTSSPDMPSRTTPARSCGCHSVAAPWSKVYLLSTHPPIHPSKEYSVTALTTTHYCPIFLLHSTGRRALWGQQPVVSLSPALGSAGAWGDWDHYVCRWTEEGKEAALPAPGPLGWLETICPCPGHVKTERGQRSVQTPPALTGGRGNSEKLNVATCM